MIKNNFELIGLFEKLATEVAVAVLEPVNGGQNKETILLTVNTFKKLCLKAGTKKADEIHDYYIKLEELLHETVNEESNELRLQLEQKDDELLRQSNHIKLLEIKTLKRAERLEHGKKLC